MADQPDFWRRRGLFAWLLLPLSAVFYVLVALRRIAYRYRWLASYRAPVPVVMIGNITVGGSGKTPLVMALAQALQQQGITCAVVSRGYGGTLCAATEVLPDSHAAAVGDEPLLIRCTTNVPVFIAAKRVEAVKAVLTKYPQTQVVLCDDGMQHYALQRDMEVAVLATDLGMGNGWLLPAGPLREPPSRLRQIDALVWTGKHNAAPPVAEATYAASAHSAGAYRLIDGVMLSWVELMTLQPLYLLTAIARPQRILQQLKAQQVMVTDVRFLADHAPLPPATAAFAQDGWLLMTGKDAVKTASWPFTLREKILILDYRVTLPAALLAKVVALIENFES